MTKSPHQAYTKFKNTSLKEKFQRHKEQSIESNKNNGWPPGQNINITNNMNISVHYNQYVKNRKKIRQPVTDKTDAFCRTQRITHEDTRNIV